MSSLYNQLTARRAANVNYRGHAPRRVDVERGTSLYESHVAIRKHIDMVMEIRDTWIKPNDYDVAQNLIDALGALESDVYKKILTLEKKAKQQEEEAKRLGHANGHANGSGVIACGDCGHEGTLTIGT